MDGLHEVLRELIAADTVSARANVAAFERLAERVEALGCRVRLQRWEEGGAEKANLIAWAGPPREGGLVLSGHLDIVPFEDQPGWTRDPLVLTAEGDRLYGRGTTDMKGFIAQCIEALERLDFASLTRPVALLFTSDEEVGCQGAGRLVGELPALFEECPQPKLCWIGEPTSWRVSQSHKGIVVLDVSVRGEGGHSSLPEAGVNAISVAARLIGEIGTVQAELRGQRSGKWASLFPDAPYTTFNIGTIRGGTASNMIAEDCHFDVSYRPLPDEDPREVARRVRERLEALDPVEWGSERPARVEVSETLVAPGMDTPRGSALEVALGEVVGDRDPGGVPFCT
ncbi:MAG: M20 family metallopeptidase, partial [Myxococcota bacterium]